MNPNKRQLTANPLPWLLEADPDNPGIRYFALRDLLDVPPDSPDLQAAQSAVMQTGPVPVILENQEAEGYWVKPGAGYAPKYRGTVWSLMFLAQLGCDGNHEQVRRAVDYYLTHAQSKNGSISANGNPGQAIHCLWGNTVWAMLNLGAWDDERLQLAVDRLARSVTGDEYGDYLKGGVQGPGFPCSANYGLPCGWGAVRVLWGLNAVPVEARTPAVQAAIQASVDFLLSYDIAAADYPYKDRINGSWFKFGYPLGYVTDVLLNLEALTEAGITDDHRLDAALDLILSEQDEQGRWKMTYSYKSKMWIDVEKKGKPGKWVTLRAMRVLKRVGLLPEEWLIRP